MAKRDLFSLCAHRVRNRSLAARIAPLGSFIRESWVLGIGLYYCIRES